MQPDVATQLAEKFQFMAKYPTAVELEQVLYPNAVTTPALRLIGDKINSCIRKPDGRLIISIPPQEGKSWLVRAACVRQLVVNPDTRIGVGCYGQDLANITGAAIRDMITDNPQFGISVSRYTSAKDYWRLAHHQGGVIARGRGAGMSGHPVDLLIIDDPFKEGEATSKAARDEAWNWWLLGLSARLSPGASVIVVMTRWHEDDLVGRLTQHDTHAGWEVINIPAQCEDPATDPLGRQLGEYLHSARGRTFAQWELRRKTAGSQAWNALYQGRPSPAEGGILKRDWWRRWTGTRWLTDEHARNWCAEGTLVQSWDLSFKGTKNADYVVGQVWQRVAAQAFLLDQVRGRWGFTETVEQIKSLTARWPQATAKYVEDKANGPAVIDALSREIPGLVPVNPQGGKESRANAVAPLIEAGNVLLPASAPWVDGLIEEAAGFPNAANDDQVDAMTQALTRLFLTQSRAGSGFYNFG